MLKTARDSGRMFRRTYATIKSSPAVGGAITIDSTARTPPLKLVKPADSKKTITLSDYVSFYRSNTTMLILQHNNLKQTQMLKLRAELGSAGAKLRVLRTGIFSHAVKVANLQDSEERYRSMDTNTVLVSKAAKRVRRREGDLDVTQLMSGPICAITFPSTLAETATIEPETLKKVISIVQGTQNKLLLLGGRFEGQVFAVDSLDRISKLPGLEVLRGQLLSVLGSPALRLTQLLGTPVQTLDRTLQGYELTLKGAVEEGKQE